MLPPEMQNTYAVIHRLTTAATVASITFIIRLRVRFRATADVHCDKQRN